MIKNQSKRYDACSDVVEEGGFEPPKRDATDLQSAPFGHSGTPPYEIIGAGGRTRTPDLLITNQLLYQLSYTSVSALSSSTTLLIISGKGRVVNRKSKKISKNFERAEWASKGQERKHEREDFYRSATGCAAGTGGGLVQALPAGDLRLGAGGGGGPVSPVPGGGKTRGNGAKQGDT